MWMVAVFFVCFFVRRQRRPQRFIVRVRNIAPFCCYRLLKDLGYCTACWRRCEIRNEFPATIPVSWSSPTIIIGEKKIRRMTFFINKFHNHFVLNETTEPEMCHIGNWILFRRWRKCCCILLFMVWVREATFSFRPKHAHPARNMCFKVVVTD